MVDLQHPPAQGGLDPPGEMVVLPRPGGSGSVSSMPTAGAAPATHGPAPGGGGESWNDAISARLGTAVVHCPLIGTTERRADHSSCPSEPIDGFTS